MCGACGRMLLGWSLKDMQFTKRKKKVLVMMKVLGKLSTCLRALHASSNTLRLAESAKVFLWLCIIQSNPLQNWSVLLELRKARMLIHSPAWYGSLSEK